MGIPVVIAENGFGVPVKPVEDGAPTMAIAENGLGAPIVISDNGVPFVVEGYSPIDWDFQPISLTAEENGQWVGFSTGGATLPQPAFGGIDGQPTAITTLLALYNDTASGRYIAVFQGAYVSSLTGLVVTFGGVPLASYERELISGNTWVRFPDGLGNLTPGAYQVTFEF